MTLKTMLCTGILALSFTAPVALSHVHAGIIDLMTDAFTKKVVAQPPAIRVLLAHDKHGVILETKGKYKLYDPLTGVRVGMSFNGKRRYMQPLADGLRWGESFPGIHQLLILPDDSCTTTMVDGIEYQGAIYVYDVGGSISVVNSLPVEDYLVTILTQRYNGSFPEELMAAITITERTKYYYQTLNGGTDFWDVDGAKEGYQGSALVRRSTPVESAIRKTQHMALASPDGRGVLSVDWVEPGAKRYKGVTYSAITQSEASKMAQAGKNAADILRSAFPATTLQLGPS